MNCVHFVDLYKSHEVSLGAKYDLVVVKVNLGDGWYTDAQGMDNDT